MSKPAERSPREDVASATRVQPRRALHAYLSPEAHETWHDFAAANGVTVSALLESLSLRLVASGQGTTGDALRGAVEAARATDSARRRRGRPRR